MSNMSSVHATNRDLVKHQPLVAVFSGGSGGIGALSLKALASTAGTYNGKGLRAYIVARNSTAADEVISDCRKSYPKGQYHFVEVEDCALISTVDAACVKVVEAETRNAALANETPRIDYLMLSHGGPIFLPRQDTEEGIDGTMARFYYSRIAFITKLLPLLLKSSLPATVVSVYAAGFEARLYADDLSLRQPSHYSYSQARSHAVYMHTCYFEELAERHAEKLRLIHIFPGLVVHKGMYSKENPWWIRLLFTKVLPFFRMDMDVDEVGHMMIALASPVKYPARSPEKPIGISETIRGTDGELGSGAYALKETGESSYPAKRYENVDKRQLKEMIWNHTNTALEQIRAGGVFKS